MHRLFSFPPLRSLFIVVALLSPSFACGSSQGNDAADAGATTDAGAAADAESCLIGALGCPCTGGGACDSGLTCNESELCEAMIDCACDMDASCSESCECDTDCPEANCLVKQYDAYSQAEGPNCGSDGGFTAECLPGDICIDEDMARCQVVHSGLDGISCPGQPYDAYSQAGGPNCGSDGGFTAECKPADSCADSDTGQCEVIGSDGSVSACGLQSYDGFTQAGGPNCGSDGGFTAECYPGDVCEDAATRQCLFVHYPDGDDCPNLPYSAYSQGGGPNCGSDGGFTAECKPADRCLDPETGDCELIGSDGGAIPCATQTYESFSQAGGPNCGSDGGFTAECYGGDVCEDPDTKRCRFVHSPSGANCPALPYQAYSQAGGPNCGSDGGFTAECKPGDSCISAATGECN